MRDIKLYKMMKNFFSINENFNRFKFLYIYLPFVLHQFVTEKDSKFFFYINLYKFILKPQKQYLLSK